MSSENFPFFSSGDAKIGGLGKTTRKKWQKLLIINETKAR
jgi:hypothetical protein